MAVSCDVWTCEQDATETKVVGEGHVRALVLHVDQLVDGHAAALTGHQGVPRRLGAGACVARIARNR